MSRALPGKMNTSKTKIAALFYDGPAFADDAMDRAFQLKDSGVHMQSPLTASRQSKRLVRFRRSASYFDGDLEQNQDIIN